MKSEARSSFLPMDSATCGICLRLQIEKLFPIIRTFKPSAERDGSSSAEKHNEPTAIAAPRNSILFMQEIIPKFGGFGTVTRR